MTAPSQAGASLQLKQMFKDVTKGAASKDMQGISCGLFNDNIFEWEIMFMVDDDIKYYGGSYPSKNRCAQRLSPGVRPQRTS